MDVSHYPSINVYRICIIRKPTIILIFPIGTKPFNEANHYKRYIVRKGFRGELSWKAAENVCPLADMRSQCNYYTLSTYSLVLSNIQFPYIPHSLYPVVMRIVSIMCLSLFIITYLFFSYGSTYHKSIKTVYQVCSLYVRNLC